MLVALLTNRWVSLTWGTRQKMSAPTDRIRLEFLILISIRAVKRYPRILDYHICRYELDTTVTADMYQE
jgi:hypothetical protein